MSDFESMRSNTETGLFADELPDESFSPPRSAVPDPNAPLAARMRPRTLDEFVGQETVVGPGTLLRRAIERDQITSVLFWGPPGSGKSTLAQIIANTTRAYFENYSAVTSGVADVRKVIAAARERRKKLQQKTILFVDEIHRWNKAQQDALLPHVEDGTVALVGATTENPYFEVNAPLLSRSRLFRLETLSTAAIHTLLERALTDKERGLGDLGIEADADALGHLAQIAGGDARNALSALESAAQATIPDEHGVRRLTLALAEEGAQSRSLGYDKDGDEHYDTISAFIKSIRGSDADASLYWLAKMLLAGEDIRFIARRLVILASEDVGNADPMALVLANSAAQAVMFVGLPEAQLILSQAVTYLATAPKSNASAMAIGRATEEVQNNGLKRVPLHLRSSAYPGGKKMGHGQDYLYPHDYPGNWVEQEYLPEGVQGLPFYEGEKVRKWESENMEIIQMAEKIQSHRDLRVWQAAVDAGMVVFELTKSFPRDERFGLTDQFRRSSRSVAANIVEAWRESRYPAAFIAKLSDAESEASESQTWIEFAVRCGYLESAAAIRLDGGYEAILAQLVVMGNAPEKWTLSGLPRPLKS